MNDRDPGLDILLALDGESFVVDPIGSYSVRFVVKQVPPSPERPHGLSYSLTLHDRGGTRLIGFDNAHAAPAMRGRGRRVLQDHKHRLETIRSYQYRDAATLLADFWTEVYALLNEKGGLP
jgi:hypothetical protein